MNAFELNPYIRVEMNSVLPPFTEIKRRIIFDYELIYIESGSFIFEYNDKKYCCDSGSIILICPGVPHSFKIGEAEVSQPHIHFDMVYDIHSEAVPISFKDITEFTDEEKRLIRPNIFAEREPYPFVKPENEAEFFRLWKKIVGNGENGYLVKKAALTEIISMLTGELIPCPTSHGDVCDIAKQIKDYLDAFQGTGMQLRDFEKLFCYSKYYLERRFKKAYGTGIIAYRNSKTMELALSLLKGHSVTEVAERLKFSSVYAFSRAFKLHYGFPPTAV